MPYQKGQHLLDVLAELSYVDKFLMIHGSPLPITQKKQHLSPLGKRNMKSTFTVVKMSDLRFVLIVLKLLSKHIQIHQNNIFQNLII